MRVSDVADAFLLIPLAPWLWPFFLFRWFGEDAVDGALYLYVHLFGERRLCRLRMSAALSFLSFLTLSLFWSLASNLSGCYRSRCLLV